MVNQVDSKIPQCLVCCQPATKRCSSCRAANYCSLNHQRQNWKQHKKFCCPYEIRQNQEFGRHLIASRDLEERSIIIQETPMIFAPYDIETSSSKNHKHSNGNHDGNSTPISICLGCCIRISNPTNRCTACTFPVCSNMCEKLTCHAEYECKIFSEKKVHFPPKKPSAFYNTILILRLMLQKQRNGTQWKKFMEMEHHYKIRTPTSKTRKDEESAAIIENLTEFFGSEEQVFQIVPKDELLEIIERVNLNSFGVARQEDDKRDHTFGRGIYLKSGIASHGCIPNAHWGLTHSPNFEMKLFASIPIKKGDVIQIPYNETWNFLATYQRQISTFDASQFCCRCSRCLDPTEFGTFLGSVKCSGCEDGFLLPENPADLNAEANWKCINSHCQHGEEQEKIMSILHYFEIQTQKTVTSIQHGGGLGFSEKLAKLDNLHKKLCQLTSQRQPKLHRNHFIVRCIQREFINLAFPHLQQLTFQELDTFILYCEQLLSVAVILTPGFNRHLAILRNYLCQAMLRKKAKAAKEGKTLAVFGSKKSLLDYLTKLNGLQQEVLFYYEFDPDTMPPNGVTSLVVKRLLEDRTVVVRDIKLTISNMIKQ